MMLTKTEVLDLFHQEMKDENIETKNHAIQFLEIALSCHKPESYSYLSIDSFEYQYLSSIDDQRMKAWFERFSMEHYGWAIIHLMRAFPGFHATIVLRKVADDERVEISNVVYAKHVNPIIKI